MPSIFTRIIQGEIPCYKVAETDQFLAFLDISPLTMGHTLVIPKVEIDELFDLDDDTLSGLILFAKKIGAVLKSSVDCVRVGLIVAGLEVPHAHVHLVPMQKEGDLNFAKPRVQMTNEDFEALAKLLSKQLS